MFGHVLPETGKEKLGEGAEQANNRTSASYLLFQFTMDVTILVANSATVLLYLVDHGNAILQSYVLSLPSIP